MTRTFTETYGPAETPGRSSRPTLAERAMVLVGFALAAFSTAPRRGLTRTGGDRTMTGRGRARPATTPNGRESALRRPSQTANRTNRGLRFEGMDRRFGKATEPPSDAAGNPVRRGSSRRSDSPPVDPAQAPEWRPAENSFTLGETPPGSTGSSAGTVSCTNVAGSCYEPFTGCRR